jgi:hypothetical protein
MYINIAEKIRKNIRRLKDAYRGRSPGEAAGGLG